MDYEHQAAEIWKNDGVPNALSSSSPFSLPTPPHRKILDGAASRQYALPDITRLNNQAAGTVALPEGVVLNNSAQNKARQAKPPDDFYELPVFVPDKFDDAFFGHRDFYLNHIAAKTVTHLSLARGDVKRIEIWGSKEGVAQAKKDLEQLKNWAFRTLQDKKPQKNEDDRIAKVRAAPSLEGWKTLFASSEKRQKLEFFKQMPENRVSEVMGFFTWPENDIKPQIHLGMNYEALNDIRTEHECYIDYDRNKKHFIILGSRPADVENALDRIYGVLCEVAAKNRLPTRAHLVEPPSTNDLLPDVYLDNTHSLVNRQITIKIHADNRGVQCYLAGREPLHAQQLEWKKKRESLLRANYAYLRQVIQQALYDIQYCRGHVRMKVNFGTLVLFHYKLPVDKSFPILEFMNVMREKSTQTELIRYIGEASVAEELTLMCRQRSDFFLPVHTINSSVSGYLERLYTATFDLRLWEGNTKSQDIRLEVQFGREEPVDGKLHYSVVTYSWLISPKRGHQASYKNNNEGIYRRKGPLDVKCLDLVAGLAWQLEVSIYSKLEDSDSYPIFGDFLKLIKLEVDSNDKGIITFTNLPGLELNAVILKTKSQWYLSHSDFIFEVTKYEFFNGTGYKFPTGVASSVKNIKPDVRWGAGLSSASWTEKLANQIHVPMGRAGAWDPDVSKFFSPSKIGGMNDAIVGNCPPARQEWEGDGFREFLDRVKECVSLISRAKKRANKREEMAKRGVREEDMD